MDAAVEGLRRVGTGLRLVFLGLVVVVINLVTAVGIVLTLAEPGKANDPAAMVASLYRDHPGAVTVLIALGVLGNVLAIAGKVFCLSVPEAAQATQYVLMAVACGGIALALNVIGQVPDLGPTAAEISHASPIFTLVGFLFFVRFLRRLAAYLGSARLLARVMSLQVGTTAFLLVLFVASIGNVAGLADAATLVVVVMLALGALVLFGLYALLVHDLRRTAEGAADYVEGRE